MSRTRNMNEVMTGIFLILVAGLAFYLASPLKTFTEVGLGPGFVPNMLGVIQSILGVILIASGLMTAGEPTDRWQFRPLLVLAGVGFFALTIEDFGFAIALTGLVLISCAAHKGTKFREAAALALGAVVMTYVVFVRLLGLSMELWPQMTWGG